MASPITNKFGRHYEGRAGRMCRDAKFNTLTWQQECQISEYRTPNSLLIVGPKLSFSRQVEMVLAKPRRWHRGRGERGRRVGTWKRFSRSGTCGARCHMLSNFAGFVLNATEPNFRHVARSSRSEDACFVSSPCSFHHRWFRQLAVVPQSRAFSSWMDDSIAMNLRSSHGWIIRCLDE